MEEEEKEEEERGEKERVGEVEGSIVASWLGTLGTLVGENRNRE